MVSNTAETAASASTLVMSHCSATAATRSFFRRVSPLAAFFLAFLGAMCKTVAEDVAGEVREAVCPLAPRRCRVVWSLPTKASAPGERKSANMTTRMRDGDIMVVTGVASVALCCANEGVTKDEAGEGMFESDDV